MGVVGKQIYNMISFFMDMRPSNNPAALKIVFDSWKDGSAGMSFSSTRLGEMHSNSQLLAKLYKNLNSMQAKGQ